MAEVSIPRNSRYKDTPLFIESGRLEFGLHEAPDEFFSAGERFRIHTVVSHEVGFLDSIAARYYGMGSEPLWWVIAQANDMIDPEAEMYAGQALVIPDADKVDAFTARDARETV